jgi:hypothetical protein
LPTLREALIKEVFSCRLADGTLINTVYETTSESLSVSAKYTMARDACGNIATVKMNVLMKRQSGPRVTLGMEWQV